MREQRQVSPRIADVIELPEPFFENSQFPRAGEVCPSVGSENPLENPQVSRYALCESALCACRQEKPPAFATLHLKIAQQVGVVRQARGVEHGTLSHLHLEVGAVS